MKFYQRFAYYLAGLTMGLFVVAMVWSGKDTRCNYFPNARVLNDLRNKPFYFSSEADAVLSEGWIDKDDIKLLLSQGDVDFDRSQTREGQPKRYVISGKTRTDKPYEVTVLNAADQARLERIEPLK